MNGSLAGFGNVSCVTDLSDDPRSQQDTTASVRAPKQIGCNQLAGTGEPQQSTSFRGAESEMRIPQ